MHLKLFLFFLIVLQSVCIEAQINVSLSKNTNKPNIILILADDLGIGMLGHEGQKIVKTPNIDMLAQEGIRFKNAYSNMLCSPSRASLITGIHDSHQNSFIIPAGGIYSKISTGEFTYKDVDSIINSIIPPTRKNQVFLGNVAKETGYKTAQFGKLEWGFLTTRNQMERHGWDTYLGYFDHERAHGFYPPFLFENGELRMIPGNTLANSGKSIEPESPESFNERWDRTGKMVYSQDLFMKGVLDFIRNNKGNPFFIYFPTQLPHGPVSIPAVHPDFIDNTNLTQIEKEYASMVKMLDDNVGQIMYELRKEGIDDNTIVIFTSDNGHEIYYSQKGHAEKPYTNIKTGKPFDDLDNKYYSALEGDIFNGNGGMAGMKRSNLQGGIKVPLIVRWPNKIKAGTTSDRLVANYDLLPTLAQITGYSDSLKVDGFSFYDTLLNKNNNQEHDFVVYSSFLGPSLITKEGWKIRAYLANNKNIFELYYLPDDFREENELSKKYPDKLATLKKKLLVACEGDFNNGYYTSKNQINLRHITLKNN